MDILAFFLRSPTILINHSRFVDSRRVLLSDTVFRFKYSSLMYFLLIDYGLKLHFECREMKQGLRFDSMYSQPQNIVC